MKLDRTQPFAQTFGPAVAQGLAYFQDGLYFLASGELNETLPANQEVLKARNLAPNGLPVAVPPTKDDLEKKSNSELFQMAQKILDLQNEAGEELDYTPTIDKRAGNLSFIRLHTE